MLRFLALTAILVQTSMMNSWVPASAAVMPFPAPFHTEDVTTNGTTLHVRVGGSSSRAIP